jgi:uncharacterized protein with PIN domain
MNKRSAFLTIRVECRCPNCDTYLDIFDLKEVKDSLDKTHNARDCNVEIECEDCNEKFIVSDILF